MLNASSLRLVALARAIDAFAPCGAQETAANRKNPYAIDISEPSAKFVHDRARSYGARIRARNTHACALDISRRCSA
jgi:hypothetical protein